MIQLSLSGIPKLVDPSEADCHIVLDGWKDYYIAEGQRVASQHDTIRRIVFALLSVNAPFGATCQAYKALAEVDLCDFWTVLARIKQAASSDGVVNYPWTKAKWINELAFHAYVEGISFEPSVAESDVEYREYLMELKGLAYAKSSFAVMLVKGQADVACIDTHIYRLFTGKPAKISLSRKRYLPLEDKVRQLAQAHDIATSVAQHCLWDAMRGLRTELLP